MYVVALLVAIFKRKNNVKNGYLTENMGSGKINPILQININ